MKRFLCPKWIEMNTKYFFILLCLLFSFSVGVLTRRWQLLLLVLPLMIYLVSSSAVHLDLELERWLCPEGRGDFSKASKEALRVIEGKKLRVRLVVRNRGKNLSQLEIYDEVSGARSIRGKNYRLCSLKKGEELSLEYELLLRRGYHQLGPVHLRAYNLQQTSSQRKTLEELQKLIVLPNLRRWVLN